MEISQTDLERITGLTPDALRFLADKGAIVPLPETDRRGRGVHRKYLPDEALFALLAKNFNELSVPAREIVAIRNAVLTFLGACQGVTRWPMSQGKFALAPSAGELSRVFMDYLFGLALHAGEKVMMLLVRSKDKQPQITMHLYKREYEDDRPDIVLGGCTLPKPVLFPRPWVTTPLERRLSEHPDFGIGEIVALDRVLAPARHLLLGG